jgi:uncharacterized coiled-coil protein SlyX
MPSRHRINQPRSAHKITLDARRHLLDNGGSLNEEKKMDESAFMKKVAGQLKVLATFDGLYLIPLVVMDAGADLCNHSEALAGYAVRDARIAELEAAVTNQSDWLVEWQKCEEKVAEQEQEINQLLADIRVLESVICKGRAEYAAPAPTPAPAVVMPDNAPHEPGESSFISGHVDGWNACLDEVASLNAVQAEVKL